MHTLPGTLNRYGGMHIDPQQLPSDIKAFSAALNQSLADWRRRAVPVVWLQLAPAQAHLMAAAIDCGFEFHHCHSHQLTLTKRLQQGAVLPSYATHTIGVAGVVIADDEILTVVERADVETRPDHLKFPGGMLEPGEDIAAGALREVMEETGVSCEFKGLIGFRHHHAGQFNTSNIYATCLLRPLHKTTTDGDDEIGRVAWMPIKDYLANPGVGLFNKRMVQALQTGRPLASVRIEGYQFVNGAYEVFAAEDANN